MICHQEAKILYARDQDCQPTRASYRASMETDLWMAYLETIMVVLTMLFLPTVSISFILIVPAHNIAAWNPACKASVLATTQPQHNRRPSTKYLEVIPDPTKVKGFSMTGQIVVNYECQGSLIVPMWKTEYLFLNLNSK